MQPEAVNHRLRTGSKSIEGFSLMVENNVYERNILNLVKEIQENEKKNEENRHDKKKKKFSSINQSPNPYPKLKFTPLNNQTIQYILSCKLRTPNMLIILNAFLSTMKFLSLSADNEDREKLLYSLSFCLKMDKKPQGSIVFRYGNKGTRFYIVLGGEVSVLILREKVVELNCLNYLKYLLYLKVIREEELAKRIIAANPKSNFKISEKHLDTYYDELITFINKYYTAVPVNELDLNEKENSNKALFKNNKQDTTEKLFSNKIIIKSYKQEYTEEDFPKGLFDNIDFKLNKSSAKGMQANKTFQKFVKHYTIGSKNKKSVQKLNIKKNLINDSEEKDNKNSENENSDISNDKSFMELNKDKIKKFNKIKSNENSRDFSKEKQPISIKYKATSKIPNYLELDIGTFGPSDCSKLVNFVIKSLENFYSKTNKVTSIEEYINNCYIDDSLTVSERFDKKEHITIYKYFEITRKREGDIFGELALQHNDNKRTATMICLKDSVFGYLSKHDYSNCLRGVEMKKRKHEVNFIMSFSLFDENNWVNFEKTYFNFFKKEYLTSGQVIINQNEHIDNIYFIMEGQVEITTSLNFKEINSILKQKNKRIKNKKNKNRYNSIKLITENAEKNNNKQQKENIENNNNKNILNNNNNDENNFSMSNNYESYDKKNKNVDNKKFAFLTNKQIKELNDIKSFRLSVIDNKDILGLNDICSKDGVSFIKATCISSSAVIFSLKKNILDELKRKNSEIDKNVTNISNKREKIMIERLKSTTKYMFTIAKDNKIKMSEVHKNDDNNDIKNKEPRTHSALYTKFSPRIYAEYNNTISNYKSAKMSKNLLIKSTGKLNIENYNEMMVNSNLDKNNLKKKLQTKSKSNYNASNCYQKENSSNNLIMKTDKNKNKSVRNFNLYNDTDKNNNSQISLEQKTCFQKFMDSVTERVTQIQKTVKDVKFTGLFSPVTAGNIKIGPKKKNYSNNNFKYKIKDSKNNKFIIDRYMRFRTKSSKANNKLINKRNNTIANTQATNNFVLIHQGNSGKTKGKNKSYRLLKFDMKNDSLKELFKNQKHIVQHQYILSTKNIENEIENRKINIITNGKNDPKQIAISEFSKKNSSIFYHSKMNKFTKFRHPKISEFNPIDYMKIILGTRYREHEVTKGEKKFSNMLTHNLETINYFSNPEFRNNLNLFLNQNKFGKYNFPNMIKPSKVDLLVYNRTIESIPDIKYRNFTNEQKTKKRLGSRNIQRRTKTICFTRTLTNSGNKF